MKPSIKRSATGQWVVTFLGLWVCDNREEALGLGCTFAHLEREADPNWWLSREQKAQAAIDQQILFHGRFWTIPDGQIGADSWLLGPEGR